MPWSVSFAVTVALITSAMALCPELDLVKVLVDDPTSAPITHTMGAYDRSSGRAIFSILFSIMDVIYKCMRIYCVYFVLFFETYICICTMCHIIFVFAAGPAGPRNYQDDKFENQISWCKQKNPTA